jgi:hypothetical protein
VTPSLIDNECVQLQDNTQINKKQKCQENAVLLTYNEPTSLQPILPSDPVPALIDSLSESLTIPPPTQMIPHSQTIEPTPGETASDCPNQENLITETNEFTHHSQESINNDHNSFEIEHPSNWHLMSGRAKNHWRQKHKSKGK